MNISLPQMQVHSSERLGKTREKKITYPSLVQSFPSQHFVEHKAQKK